MKITITMSIMMPPTATAMTMPTKMPSLMMSITTTPAIKAEARETDNALKQILEKLGV